MGGVSDPNVTFVTIFSCEAQLNKSTFVSVCPSVCLSVRFKTEFNNVWSAYDKYIGAVSPEVPSRNEGCQPFVKKK